MLVLSRRIGESLVLIIPPSSEPTAIRVMNTDIRDDHQGHRAKLGINAPLSVEVHRLDIIERLASGQEFHGSQNLRSVLSKDEAKRIIEMLGSSSG